MSAECETGYEYSENAGHFAWCAGPVGGVHVHCHPVPGDWYSGELWIGGIEYHDITGEGEPSQDECWVLGGRPCWHDGTSLGFARRVAPMLPPPDGQAFPPLVQQYLTEFCQREYNAHFRPGQPD